MHVGVLLLVCSDIVHAAQTLQRLAATPVQLSNACPINALLVHYFVSVDQLNILLRKARNAGAAAPRLEASPPPPRNTHHTLSTCCLANACAPYNKFVLLVPCDVAGALLSVG
jgi:hypothetical protein